MLFDMRHIQQATLWLAALCATVGTACIVAFLVQQRPDAYLLFDAAIAATASVAALIASVAMVCVESMRREAPSARRVNPPPPDPIVPAESTQFRERQDVLAERLDIDELRFCTQAKLPCTCWSFCGGDASAGTVQVQLHGRAGPAPLVAMPVVPRSGISGCHLTSPQHAPSRELRPQSARR